MKEIQLNDSLFSFSGESVEDLIRHLESNKEGVAVALNDDIVPKSVWGKTLIRHGDTVLIFESIVGG
ncbi:sulfur carrier protein ThiS [Marinomonas sp. 2405UD68-3]|uniref:sulfur carrier protein ThiS n=1 Tax=Marinomonas sp. 2405UD68-3 TaxID=3391835 RepID=UPI0039C91B82